MEGLGATLHTPPLHGKRRVLEAELGEELGRSLAACAEHPRDLNVGAHSSFDKPATDAAAAMRCRNDEHGEVAIGLTIGDSTNKAHDLAPDNGDVSDLRCFDKRTELLNATNALTPAIRGEQLMYARKLGGLDSAELHDA